MKRKGIAPSVCPGREDSYSSEAKIQFLLSYAPVNGTRKAIAKKAHISYSGFKALTVTRDTRSGFMVRCYYG